jgi:hypothetical protein
MTFSNGVISSRHAETAAGPRGGAQDCTAYLAPQPSAGRERPTPPSRSPLNGTVRCTNGHDQRLAFTKVVGSRGGEMPPLKCRTHSRLARKRAALGATSTAYGRPWTPLDEPGNEPVHRQMRSWGPAVTPQQKTSSPRLVRSERHAVDARGLISISSVHIVYVDGGGPTSCWAAWSTGLVSSAKPQSLLA